MIKEGGKQRVIIEHVRPEIDGGAYPAKRTIGERVDVSAHIFADGHDKIRALVMYSKAGSDEWKRVEMHHQSNDEWSASFSVNEMGEYIFEVHAWIDHFLTAYEGFKKKAEAGLMLDVELKEIALFLKDLAESALKKEEQKLLALAKILEDEDKYHDAFDMMLSEDFERIVWEHPLIRHESQYSKPLRVVVESEKARFSSWYELFPRSAAKKAGVHGTFKDCEKLLPRIEAMGFDVLYLPPIHPIGKVNRKGKNNSVDSEPDEPGSPWAIGSDEGGHKSVHAELGTLADYKSLVRKARKQGIDVALDIAFQCAPDHPYVKEHPKWFKWRPDGTVQYAENPPKKYQDILPLNFENDDWEGLWNELKSAILYWVEAGVNIFRVDNPHTKPIQFWEWVIKEVNKDFPEVIFLSEAFTRPKVMASLAKVGFTQSYTYFTWRNSKAELLEYMHDLTQTELRDYFRPNFWPNTPDILPYSLQHSGESIFIARFALAATLSSNYGMYGPVYEFGANEPVQGKEEYFNSEKYEIKHHDWEATNRLTEIIALVNMARKDNESLQYTYNVTFCDIGNDNLIAYLKATDDLSNITLMVVNLDPHNTQSGYVRLPKERLGLADKINVKLHDLIMEEHYTWTEEWNYISLNPHQLPFHLFKLDIKESNL
ncbi:MAG: alpha-1,4-glucan--maltose-1-phosphate maltosyltransferase [Bacteroidota bacterium]